MPFDTIFQGMGTLLTEIIILKLMLKENINHCKNVHTQ